MLAIICKSVQSATGSVLEEILHDRVLAGAAAVLKVEELIHAFRRASAFRSEVIARNGRRVTAIRLAEAFKIKHHEPLCAGSKSSDGSPYSARRVARIVTFVEVAVAES
jgi:hypothetical protein